MYALWARAAQVRSTCRCSLCASPANVLARRATKVPVRRGIRQQDVFLVFSSTIAFEAAVIDSVRKDARSKQWDKIIDEGKELVESVEADQRSRVRALLDRAERRLVQDADLQQNSLRDQKSLHLSTEDYNGLDWSWQGTFSWAARCDKLRASTGFEDWKGPPLSLLKTLTAAELRELLTDKRILRHFYGGLDCENLEADPVRPTISTKKSRTLEWSMVKLVLRMLWAICGESSYKLLTGVPTNYLASVVPLEDALSFSNSWNDKLIQANAKLDQLYSHAKDSDIYDYFERPATPSYDAGIETWEDELSHLNTTLHATLREMKAGEKLDSLMAKICQQLLLSRTPPNIHTYNLLLVRFCQLEEISLVHFVLESMWESHIRPNEITHATVLRFFTVTGNKTEFALYVKRMRGLKGGLALADPDKIKSPLVRSQIRFFGNSLQKIAQKARMNQEVYTALIIGLLRFFDPEDAMYWYRAMIDQGWRPGAELLTAILRECCLRADWNAGVAVWQQFSKEALQVTVVAYEWMLRLCQRCERHQAYSIVLHEGIQRGTLTARILSLPTEAKSGDIGAILTQAQNEVVAQLDQKAVDAPLRKRLRQLRTFEATEGHHHLLENALLGSPSPDQELNAKVRFLAGEAGRLKALRSSIARHEKTFNDLNADIAETLDDINTLLARVRIRDSVLKFGLSVNLPGLPLQDSPAILLALYDYYKSTSGGKLERDIPIAIPPGPSSALGMFTPMQPRFKGFRELSDPSCSAGADLTPSEARA